MREKGIIQILLILATILLVGIGAYYLGFKKLPGDNNPVPQQRNTTTPISSKIATQSENLAFIRNDNLWVSTNGSEKQLTNDAVPTEIPFWTGLPAVWYSNPQISLDGSSVAFLRNVNTNSRQLYVSSIEGIKMRKLVDDASWTFHTIQWSKDNKQLFYISELPNQVDQEGRGLLKVKAININTGIIHEYGQFAVRSGCGGASSDIADHLVAGENIKGVGGGVMIFNLSSDNQYIVHSISCTGSGSGVLNLGTKQDTTINDKAKNGAISPDGKKLAYTKNKSISIMELSSGKILNTYTTSEIPVVILWSPDAENIYYSSDKLVNELKLDDKVGMTAWGSSSILYRVNLSSLWILSFNSQKDKKIADLDAHAVKPLYLTGGKLIFVSVENATQLFKKTDQSTSKKDLVKYYPQVSLQAVDLTSLKVETIINQVQEASYQKFPNN